LHEYAKVFVDSYPQHPYPELGEEAWASFEKISGFSKAFITEWINLDEIDPLPVSICLFFVFPQRFEMELPEVFATLSSIFKQNP